MSTLYEITGQYLELYEMMESADELEMKVIEDTLDGMDGELEEKAENYALIMAELDAEAAKFEKEADRLAARAGRVFPNQSNRAPAPDWWTRRGRYWSRGCGGMVDATDSKSVFARSVGSSPTTPTNKIKWLDDETRPAPSKPADPAADAGGLR